MTQLSRREWQDIVKMLDYTKTFLARGPAVEYRWSPAGRWNKIHGVGTAQSNSQNAYGTWKITCLLGTGKDRHYFVGVSRSSQRKRGGGSLGPTVIKIDFGTEFPEPPNDMEILDQLIALCG